MTVDEPHTHTSAEQFFRVQFLAAVDSVLANIDAFFTSTNLTSYKLVVRRADQRSCRRRRCFPIPGTLRVTTAGADLLLPTVRALQCGQSASHVSRHGPTGANIVSTSVNPASSASGVTCKFVLCRAFVQRTSPNENVAPEHDDPAASQPCDGLSCAQNSSCRRDIAAEFVDRSSDTRRSVFGRF